MPEYTYRCKKCDTVFQDMNTISKRGITDCECGGEAIRDTDAELAHSRGERHKWITENERWSRSMGVPVKQLAEFRKKYPHHVYNDKGYLLVKNIRHKRKQAKERGFVELYDNSCKAYFR